MVKDEDAKKKVIQFRKEGTGPLYRDWLARCYEGFRFKAGDQWESEEIAILKTQNRPAITINRVLPVLNLLSGSQRQNRQDFKVYARKGGNEESASIQTELLKHTIDVTNSEWKLSTMFDDGNAGGKGWLGLGIDFDNDPVNGDIKLERLSPFEIIDDPLSKNYDINDDSRFIIRKYIWDQDELILRYPKHERKIKSLTSSPSIKEGGAVNDVDEDDYNRGSEGDFFGRIRDQRPGVELFEVSECWWKSWEHRTILTRVETMESFIVNEPNEKDIAVLLNEEGIKKTERVVAILHKTTLVGDSLLEHVDDPFKGMMRYPFIRYVPILIDGISIGMVDNLIGPQKEHNKRRSQALQHLNITANSGWVGDIDALTSTGWKELESFGAKPGNVIKKKPGSYLERIEPARLSEGHLVLSETSAKDIREISGVNIDLQGLSGQEASGRAIELKQRQGMMINEILFDNFYYSLQLLGDLLLEVFRKTNVYSPEEVMAIANKANVPASIESSKSFIVGRYGTKVSLSSKAPTIRMSNHFALMEASNAGLPISPKFAIMNSELPDKEEIIQDIDQQQQAAAQQAQQAQQLEETKVQNDLEVEMAKLQIAQEKNDIERLKIQQEHEEKDRELAIQF